MTSRGGPAPRRPPLNSSDSATSVAMDGILGDSPYRREGSPAILGGLRELRAEAEAVLRSREAAHPGRDSAIKDQLARERAGMFQGGMPTELCAAVEEELRKGQAELASREREVTQREQRLAEREADVHSSLRVREQMLLEREQRLAAREAELSDRCSDLTERQDLWRKEQLIERDEFDVQKQEQEKLAQRLLEEEERLAELRKALEDKEKAVEGRDMHLSEARKEAAVLKPSMLKQPRMSPRSGKENQELQKMLEEQQNRIQAIKHTPDAWDSQTGLAGADGGA